MRWYKADVDSGTNLKMRRAGRLGRELFRGLMELHYKHGEGGLIPKTRAEPDALALSLPAYELSGEEVREGLTLCEVAQLIEVFKDGAIRLRGYDRDWMPACSRCHKPNKQQQFKTCPECRGSRRSHTVQTNVARVEPDRTGTGQDRTGTGQDRDQDWEQEQDRDADAVPAPGNVKSLLALFCLAGWADGDTKRQLQKARDLDSWGYDESEIAAVWQHCQKTGTRPGGLFTSLTKSQRSIDKKLEELGIKRKFRKMGGAS